MLIFWCILNWSPHCFIWLCSELVSGHPWKWLSSELIIPENGYEYEYEQSHDCQGRPQYASGPTAVSGLNFYVSMLFLNKVSFMAKGLMWVHVFIVVSWSVLKKILWCTEILMSGNWWWPVWDLTTFSQKHTPEPESKPLTNWRHDQLHEEENMAKFILSLCLIFELWHSDNLMRWPVPYSIFFHTLIFFTWPVKKITL